MSSSWFASLRDNPDHRSLVPALEELCRIHEVSMELIERSDDLDDLLDLILQEYERRLQEIPNDAFELTEQGVEWAEEDPRLRGLVLFASQAAALKTKAEVAAEIRQSAGKLQRSNDRLQGVMEAMDTGVLIVDRSGKVRMLNRAAAELAGRDEADLVGSDASPFLGEVPPTGSGQVRFDLGGAGSKIWLVSRRNMDHGSTDEVVLVKDVTEHEREREERHESERLESMLHTVGVLAHKINNPLTALLGRAQLLRLGNDDEAARARALEVIEEAAHRIAMLIRHLARLAKEGTVEGLDEALDVGKVAGLNTTRKS